MIFAYILLGLSCIGIVFCVVMLFKNINTYNNRKTIIEGICSYLIDCIDNDLNSQVCYDDMEDYEKTLWRLWDWSYKRILPKEKFEIIKPYIGKKVGQ